jgi:hypothetical protein
MGVMSLWIKLGCLIAPRRPAFAALSSEQLDVGASYQPLDAAVDPVRLAGVFAARRDDALAYIGVKPLGLSARGKETDFGVGASPVAHPHTDVDVLAEHFYLSGVSFHPREGARLVGETPSLYQSHRLRQQRPRDPHEQGRDI